MLGNLRGCWPKCLSDFGQRFVQGKQLRVPEGSLALQPMEVIHMRWTETRSSLYRESKPFNHAIPCFALTMMVTGLFRLNGGLIQHFRSFWERMYPAWSPPWVKMFWRSLLAMRFIQWCIFLNGLWRVAAPMLTT